MQAFRSPAVMSKTALIAGATGLVGGCLLRELLDSGLFKKVIVIGRNTVGYTHPRLVERLVIYNKLGQSDSIFKVDAVFCCLGTTLREAGSREQFRLIDFEYCHRIASLARAQSVPEFHILSSLGADPESAFFYSRVKGEIEQAVRQLGFRRMFIYRLSLLLGRRAQGRPWEALATVLAGAMSPFLIRGLRKYRPVRAEAVARAMLHKSSEDTDGEHIVEPPQIKALAYGVV